MDIVEQKYTIQGCISGCKHLGDERIEESITTHPKTKERYTLREINPVCQNNTAMSSRGQIRTQIYERAEAAKLAYLDHVRNSGMEMNIVAIHRANKAWDKVANEWRNFQCPFFEPISLISSQ